MNRIFALLACVVLVTGCASPSYDTVKIPAGTLILFKAPYAGHLDVPTNSTLHIGQE